MRSTMTEMTASDVIVCSHTDYTAVAEPLNNLWTTVSTA